MSRRPSGYNLYVKHNLSRVRGSGTVPNAMKKVAKEWGKLSDSEKGKWSKKGAKAAPIKTKKRKSKNEDGAVKKTRKKRGPSGYNLFVKNRMKTVLKKGGGVTTAMKKIGKEWSKLSDAEKEKWNRKAKGRKATTKKAKATKKASTKTDKCPKGKILNPATGRCVNRSGALGKKLAGEDGEAPKKKRGRPKKPTTKTKKKATKKKTTGRCPAGTIRKKTTGECVDRKSRAGKMVIAARKRAKAKK